jgi:hypothetical protein
MLFSFIGIVLLSLVNAEEHRNPYQCAEMHVDIGPWEGLPSYQIPVSFSKKR